MGKTVQIDDDVIRAAERLAAERGVTPGAVISAAARKLLLPQPAGQNPGPGGTVLKNGWYVLPKRGGPPITTEMVAQLLDDVALEDAGVKRGE